MNFKAIRIFTGVPGVSDDRYVELACSFPGAASDSDSPHHAMYTIKVAGEDLAGKTLAEIEAHAIAIASALHS